MLERRGFLRCSAGDDLKLAGARSLVTRRGGRSQNANGIRRDLLTLSNKGTDAINDIDIATGEAASDEASPQLMVLASGLTKRLDAAWAAGTNHGMRDSAAAIVNGTTYNLYLVRKPNGVDVDIYAHTSTVAATVLTALQAETGDSAYAHARRIARSSI